MIITCKECSTNFNLDDSLVKESGTKCRCSVCKHIFTAYPLPMEDDQKSEESLDLQLESDPSDFEIESEDFSFEDDTELEIESSDPDPSGLEPSEFELSDLEMDESDLQIETEELDTEFDSDDSDLDMDDLEIEEDVSDLEMSDSELEIEEHDLEIDENELELESAELTIEDSEFEIESSELTPELKMDDTDIDPEPDPEDSDLDMDDSFSFDDDGFGINDDDELQSQESQENDGLDFDIEDDGIEFEVSDEDDDLGGIEFEPLEDDEPVSMEIEGESSLTRENDDAGDENTDEEIVEKDEFELEFDIEDDADTKDVEEEPSVITPEENFSEYDEALNQETEPEDEEAENDEIIEEETIEIDDTKEDEITTLQEDIQYEEDVKPMLVPKTSRRKRKKSRLGTPVLLLLLICLLVFGAYIASIMTGYKIPYISDIQIPFIEQYLKKSVDKASDAKPVPNQKSVNGRFVTNSTAGTLFVITGRVENPSDTAYNQIQIQGALITKDKKATRTKDAFCGNIIPEDMLKTGNITDIHKLLAVKKGASNLNADVQPKTSIPFMIVFSELPEKLQNFTVKVIGFKKTDTK